MIIKKIFNKILLILEYMSLIALYGIAVFIFAQIVFRNFFSIGLSWTNELSRFLNISLVFLMLPVLLKEEDHVKIDFIISRLPEKIEIIIKSVISIITCFFGIYFLRSFLQLMGKVGNVPTAVLNWPNLIFFFSGFLGSLFVILFALEKLSDELFKMRDVK
ncbi:MAG: TRAP transporter small permease subunit [Firmicutes bacterium]|nr:TRAP transporter small permease subunit [Bacillota bacterium]